MTLLMMSLDRMAADWVVARLATVQSACMYVDQQASRPVNKGSMDSVGSSSEPTSQ